MVTASHDGTARVWDAKTGRAITPATGTMRHSVAVRDACFSPDGGRVATAGFDGMARIWDAASGEPLSPPLYHGGVLQHVRFTPDGLRVMTVGSDSTVRLWNLTTVGSSAVTVELASGANHAVFDPGGSRFATACADGTARVWDATTGHPLSPVLSHGRGVTHVAFRGDGRLIATAGHDSMARIWDAQTGAPVTPPLMHEDTVSWVVFSPDGSRLASASAGGSVRIWDVATGRPAAPPVKHDNEVVHLAYSPDGRMLASASKDGTARVCDATTGASLMPAIRHETGVSCVAFHPGGRLLVTACTDGTIAGARGAAMGNRQWAARRPSRCEHGDGVLWVAYSPDGSLLATASEDRTARLWDAKTGAPITPPLAHRHQVCSLEWSADGRRLATCTEDGSARVWDTATGEPLSTPFPHEDQTRITSVTFRRDGGAILTSGRDGTVRVWNLPLEHCSAVALILEAQVRAGRRIDETGGEVALTSGELATAWEQLRRDGPGGATFEPSSVSVVGWHRREARRLTARGHGAAAAWHLHRLAEMQPDDYSIAEKLAVVCEGADDWNNVALAASRAIASGSSAVETVVRRGWALLHLGRAALAAADFEHALEREPRSAAFHLGLFLATAERGDLTLANAHWRQVIDDQDEPSTDRWNYVSAHLARLTKSRPEVWWFWRARGHISMRLGHPDQADTYFDKAIAANPDDSWSWLGRGHARKSRNQVEAALADFAQCVKLEPNVPAGWGMRAEILGSLGRWDEAARAFERWAALGGDQQPIPWYLHALLRLYSGDLPGYRRACQTMLERFATASDPFHRSLVAHAATLSPDSGVDPGRATQLAEQAARTNMRDIWMVYTVGVALRRAGRVDEAVTWLDQASGINPDWPPAPLVAAVRELCERASVPQAGRAPNPGATTVNSRTSHFDGKKLQSEIRKTNAAWQFQIEAWLLGRELDAISAGKRRAVKAYPSESTAEEGAGSLE